MRRRRSLLGDRCQQPCLQFSLLRSNLGPQKTTYKDPNMVYMVYGIRRIVCRIYYMVFSIW